MKKILAFVAVAGVAAAASATDPVAYWAFNTNNLPGGGFGYQSGSFPLAADFGAQAGSANVTIGGGILSETIVNGNGDTVLRWAQSFAGSTVNAQFGEPSGGSLAIQGGTDNANNGAFIDVNFDGSLLQNTLFSFDGRRTSTGFNNVTIQAFDGGSLLGNLATGLNLNSSGFDAAPLVLNASILDGVTDASIRFVLNGVTGATGNVRLDNFFITANIIPAPGAFALLGLGGLAAARRRR